MLGRGLESLIPPEDQRQMTNDIGQEDAPKMSPAKPSQSHLSEAIFHIEVDSIKPNPHQPRRHFDEESLRDLAASIREVGILQPLVVSKIETETESGTNVEYRLIAGERRLLAAKMAGLERVPVIVKRIIHDRERLEIAIIENLQRADLNPIETARAYAKLQDEFGMTQREIASRIGKSREAVANTLRLLSLPSEIQDAVAAQKISESQARILLSVSDLGEQQRIFREIVANNLTVRQLKARTKTVQQQAASNKQQDMFDPEVAAIQERLAEFLGMPVKVVRQPAEQGGKIIITFYSAEEFEEILHKLGCNP